MTFPVFTWFPDVEGQGDIQPDVNVQKFGDGYEQRTAIGINFIKDKWSLTFTRAREEGLAILKFLRARGALNAFTWTNPLGETGTYKCASWKPKSLPGGLEITADFEQVFEY